MIVTIKDEVLDDIKANGEFITDGCSCGDFFYKLNDKLFLNVYRSCRKSSNTPDEKLWELHDPTFYEAIEEKKETNYYGNTYLDGLEFGEELENVRLNGSSLDKLILILKGICREEVGVEYRDEDY